MQVLVQPRLVVRRPFVVVWIREGVSEALVLVVADRTPREVLHRARIEARRRRGPQDARHQVDVLGGGVEADRVLVFARRVDVLPHFFAQAIVANLARDELGIVSRASSLSPLLNIFCSSEVEPNGRARNRSRTERTIATGFEIRKMPRSIKYGIKPWIRFSWAKTDDELSDPRKS